MARLGLALLGYATLRRLLSSFQNPRQRTVPHPGDIDRVVWAVRTGGQKILGDKPCLTEAMATQLLLNRRRLSTYLQIGVARGEQGKLEAHAWIEHEGRILIGNSPDVERFSRHKRDPSNRYYAPLRIWKDRRRAARKVSRHPRVLTVRYEDLVADPGKVQQEIEDRIPFLRRKADFVDFHKTATLSDLATKALGGIRAISTSSIGNWRQHKSRLVGQLAKFGPIDEDLVFYGYERDDSWQRELDGVMADNTPSTLRDRLSLKARILRPPRRAKRILRYWISVLCEADG